MLRLPHRERPSWSKLIALLIIRHVIRYVNGDAQDLTVTLSEPITMPPGCTCLSSHKNDDGIASRCKFFNCACQCDLTPGKCDLNCCCDRDCLEREVNHFAICDNDGSINPTPNMCHETQAKIEAMRSIYPERIGDSPEVNSQRIFGDFMNCFLSFLNFIIIFLHGNRIRCIIYCAQR